MTHVDNISEVMAQIVRDNKMRREPCGCVYFEGVMTCVSHTDKPRENEIEAVKKHMEYLSCKVL